jgi:small subunit ribosomal protein S20
VAKRTASAKKQARAGARRAARNRGAKSEVKTLIVKARRSLTESGAAAGDRTESAVAAMRALDRAAAKGILHKNNVARRKSRLAKRLAKVVSSAGSTAAAAAGRGKKAATAPTRATSSPKKK